MHCIYTDAYVHMRMWMYFLTFFFIYMLCVCVCVYRYILVYTYIHVHMHTHMHIHIYKRILLCWVHLGQKSVLLAARIMLLQSLYQISLMKQEWLLPDKVTPFQLIPKLTYRGKQSWPLIKRQFQIATDNEDSSKRGHELSVRSIIH